MERKPAGYWTKERCHEEARKYFSRHDFWKYGDGASYQYAWKNGWLNEWFSPKEIKPDGWWDSKEHVLEEAKKYGTKTRFSENASGAYRSALKNGWLKDCKHFKNNLHTKEDYWVYAYEDIKNKVVYVGLTFRKRRHIEHKRSHDVVWQYFGDNLPEQRILMEELGPIDAQYYEDWYKIAYKKQMWTVINIGKTGVGSSSLGGSAIKWNKGACEEKAKQYSTKVEFKNNCPSAYNAAYKNGWLNEWFKDQIKHWTYEECKKEAEKYSKKADFVKKSGSAYRAALKNGWLDSFTFSPREAHNKKWFYDNCKEEANKYVSRSLFALKNGSAYDVARKNGWLDEFFPKK